MPSVSKKQHVKMSIMAGSPDPKKRKAGKEFLAADKRSGKFQGKKKR